MGLSHSFHFKEVAMFEKLKDLYKANLELQKHRKEIDRYNKAWEKIKKEQASKEA